MASTNDLAIIPYDPSSLQLIHTQGVSVAKSTLPETTDDPLECIKSGSLEKLKEAIRVSA